MDSSKKEGQKADKENQEEMMEDEVNAVSLATSSGFEPETPLAAEFRHDLEWIISRVFGKYMRLSKITKHMKEVKNMERLKAAHQQMMARLEDKVTKYISEMLEDTSVIQKLNEISSLEESHPLTFEDVWRPSGDAEEDLKCHLAPIHGKMEQYLTASLSKIKEDNRDKLAEIKHLEAGIAKKTNEIQVLVKHLQDRAAQEVAKYEKMKAEKFGTKE